ncbi:MAG: NapC/NirT family cytochrome c [Gammaproteobacteria bacterium]
MTDKDKQAGGLWRRPSARWALGIPVGALLAFFAGAIALGSFNWVIHATSTTDFCLTACHSHTLFVKPEYEASTHFSNRSGVRAECADCHIPKGWFSVVAMKVAVSGDIIPELMGKLNTEEKWEAHRGEMAEDVWAQFRANDSQFCRHCHDPASMNSEKQSPMAARIHASLEPGGKTCIDCHRGIVHALPQATASN